MFRPALIAAALAFSLTGCQTTYEQATQRLGQAALHFPDGSPAGTARLIAQGDRVDIAVSLTGLMEGQHGLHLHMTGRCTAPDFASAGGHLNPANRAHGHENPAGTHLGDLPNAIVNASGTANVSATLPGSRAEVLAEIFDGDGTAIVVHAGPDDYRTDPAGNSGGRIACGAFSAG